MFPAPKCSSPGRSRAVRGAGHRQHGISGYRQAGLYLRRYARRDPEGHPGEHPLRSRLDQDRRRRPEVHLFGRGHQVHRRRIRPGRVSWPPTRSRSRGFNTAEAGVASIEHGFLLNDKARVAKRTAACRGNALS
ncbi:MAG: hypothetical protein MZV70_70980 [Desulfobacterales bacterium]|nr:hypothetical protein [Desulfobacterales bacterium]